jgi:hypothetical protein
MKHNHKEAFHLMRYKCKECSAYRVIYNTRDGVTPFGVPCPECNPGRLFDGGFMFHIQWHMDIYSPKHVPKSGELLFVGPPEEPKLETMP